MPTVHCPTCKRALNLPESADIASARCPLCQTAFEVPSRAAPPLPLPSVPRAVVRQTDAGQAAPRPPFDFDDDQQDLPPAPDRRAVQSACKWMKGAGLTGLSHLFFCACVSFAFVNFNEALVLTYCGSYVFQLFASLMVYNGANALHRRTSAGWVYIAAVLALVLSALTLLLALPVLSAAIDGVGRRGMAGEDLLILIVAGLLNLAVILSFLIAGVKAILAVRRESVRRGFQR
jgi:hypothetical protein